MEKKFFKGIAVITFFSVISFGMGCFRESFSNKNNQPSSVTQSNSKLTTDTEIGIGDSLESILNKYDEVYGNKRQGDYQAVFISGANKYVTYYPKLIFELEYNRITRINLSNEQNRP